MREKNLKKALQQERESEKHVLEVWLDGLSCCTRSRNKDCTDCECIDKRPEIYGQRS